MHCFNRSKPMVQSGRRFAQSMKKPLNFRGSPNIAGFRGCSRWTILDPNFVDGVGVFSPERLHSAFHSALAADRRIVGVLEAWAGLPVEERDRIVEAVGAGK